MSVDTEPVIHTVGSVDKHDQTKLGDEIPNSTDDVLPKVSDSKLDHTERRREKGSDVTRPGAQDNSASPHPTSELGVVGQIQTVGSATPAGGGTTADSGIES